MDIQLIHHARFGGCAAKIGPGYLSNVLCGIDIPENVNVIIGFEGFEDAGVYRLNHDLAIVHPESFVREDDMNSFVQEASRLSVDYWMIGRFMEEPRGRIRIRWEGDS